MRRIHGWAVAASLALPVLLLAGMAGRAEWAVRDGIVIRVPIAGYDPRDMLRGHFLRYRLAWNWVGGEPPGNAEALCVLARTDNPPVLRYADDAPPCPLLVRLAPGGPAFRPVGVTDELFVPEASADALQKMLRSGGAAVTVDLVIAANGTARIKGWQVDGKPIAEWAPPPAR